MTLFFLLDFSISIPVDFSFLSFKISEVLGIRRDFHFQHVLTAILCFFGLALSSFL